MSSATLFWKKVEAGKRWHMLSLDGKIIGYIHWVWDGWDGYLVTGKKWPDGAEYVTQRAHSRYFWDIRRCVESKYLERETTRDTTK